MLLIFLANSLGLFSLKIKKGDSIVNAFQKILKESNQKPNKIWVDKGSEFYNKSFKKRLKDNDIEMYLIRNEGKSVLAEKFIRKLITKIYTQQTFVGLQDVFKTSSRHVLKMLKSLRHVGQGK